MSAPQGVRRYVELLEPAGVHDELRVRLAVDGEQWGTVILYRFEERHFTAEDVAVATAAAPVIARALRTALLRAVCDSPAVGSPPGSLVLGEDDAVLVTSAAAEDLLAALPERQVLTVLANLGSATRARGTASLTVTGPGGVLSFHGSPAKGVDGAVAAVVERPRPVELSPLLMRVLGFTPREREVVEGLLQGASRTHLARRLRMTEHTLGDHLRTVYGKAGVAGRAELAALLFGRHYEPPRSRGYRPVRTATSSVWTLRGDRLLLRLPATPTRVCGCRESPLGHFHGGRSRGQRLRGHRRQASAEAGR
nr:LuxR C-terminal-related transcriptional regulator [Blastococcus mobilis]